ncbi:IS3 family transposase [Shinella sp.]|uniref:IS3 family transposase n=1 Tax=Shinella sp. TaxID=1870904 RepID=UPI00289FEC9C|nr:IS3 family transposase [Shinella sp.]
MSNEFRQVDLMIGDVRRRRWTTERKLQIIEESYAAGETVSSAARRHGVAANLLYRWRRLLSEGGAVAADSDEPVIGSSEVKKLEDRVRELEHILGRKTLENEILREALSKAQSKNRYRGRSCCRRTVPDEDGGRCPGCVTVQSRRASQRQVQAAWLIPQSGRCRGAACHSQACRCSTDIWLSPDRCPSQQTAAAADLPVVNRKRVHRIMANHVMTLEKHTAVRIGRFHNGKVMVIRSNLRWCSDGLEFTCWNGEVVRLAFIIDAFDREIISWAAVANAGISGSDIRDMMLEAIEKRFGTTSAPHAIEHLSDSGSAYTARETRLFAQALNLIPCFTPVASPRSNGMSEAFVKTLKRDYIRISPIPDADTALRKID